MSNGDNPELGIEITGDSSSAVAAATNAEQKLAAVSQAAVDAAFASGKLARAQEDAAAAFYDVVKAQEAELSVAKQASSVDIALTESIKLKATAYDSVRVALEQNRQSVIAFGAAQESANRILEQQARNLLLLNTASEQSSASLQALGGHGSTAFGKLVQGGRAAHGAMMGFNTAAQGGVATAVGLSRAFNDLFILVSASAAAAGPWALLALGIGVVLGALRGLTGHFGSHKKAVDEAAVAHKKFHDEALDRLKQIEEEVSKLTQKYAILESQIQSASNKAKEFISDTDKLSHATAHRDREKELSKATNDEDRKLINEKYDLADKQAKTSKEQRDVDNEGLAVQIKKDASQDHLNELANERRKLESDLQDKQVAFTEAQSKIDPRLVKDVFSTGDKDELVTLEEKQKAALAARARRDEASKNLEKFDKDNAIERNKLSTDIFESNFKLREIPTKTQAISTEAEADTLEAVNKQNRDREAEAKKIQKEDSKNARHTAELDVRDAKADAGLIEVDRKEEELKKKKDREVAELKHKRDEIPEVFRETGNRRSDAAHLAAIQKQADSYDAHIAEILRAYEESLRKLEKQRRQLEASRSFQSPGS